MMFCVLGHILTVNNFTEMLPMLAIIAKLNSSDYLNGSCIKQSEYQKSVS